MISLFSNFRAYFDHVFVTTEDGTAVQLTPSPGSCPNSDEQQSRTFTGGRDKVQQQQQQKQQLLFSQQD